MVDISVRGVRKAFEQDKEILRGVTFEINEGEHVGLLGKNGGGKTTLFRIITGELEPDAGEVVIGTGKRVGVMTQIPVFPPEYTAEDVLKSAFRRLDDLQMKLAALREEMAEGGESTARAYDRLQTEFEALGGYETDFTLAKVANGLDLPPELRGRLFASLSGGEKTRVNLARLILEQTDILLLDEPTNHLDLRATEWLEDYLAHFKGTVLTISHDRYFLDHAVSRIMEMTGGIVEHYSGNYSFFVVEKQRRFEEAQKIWEKNQKKIAQLQKAADDLHLWAFMGADKLHKRAFSMEKRIERLQQQGDKPKQERRMRARFGETEFRGADALVVHGLSKAYGDRTLFRDLELQVTGGERIALLGDNGAGKTTLLHVLTGREPEDRGVVKFGPSVKWAMLEQQIRFEHMDRTLVDTMLYEGDCAPQEARDRLGAFGFSGEDAFKWVSDLSGGELTRLRLCILMKADVNFLILDEPTNHLDIISREWIEDALEDYGEALLLVSHDRYFIRRFATRIWELQDGQLQDYRCGYDEYRERKERREQVARAEKKQEPADKPKKKASGPSPERRRALLEKQIQEAEAKAAETERLIEENATDYQRLEKLFREKAELERQIEDLYARWDAVE
ncbi:MAG: ABC-F family ATP-binding cassette domain-containing protein [Oscillospiraceae bacterium]|nr:ABC-F family ATP-binding cassette domain-containing protein [Oscillospiraceae bacterium]